MITKKAIKNVTQFTDLYKWSVTVTQLKKMYSLVSFCKNSKPTPGSLTLSTKYLNVNDDTIVKKSIIHNNLDLTLVTNQGWLKFSN